MTEYRWSDLTVGLSAQFEVQITESMIEAFAEISGDRNPMHLDEQFATAAGFPGRVVYGLLTSSFYSQLVGMYLPGKHALLHGIDVEFKQPAFIGDQLTVIGKIEHLTPAYQRLEIAARILNQQGKTVSKAKIRAAIHGS